jgi:hypothetical protein
MAAVPDQLIVGGGYSVLQHGLVSELIERRREAAWAEAARLLVPASKKGWVVFGVLLALVLLLGTLALLREDGETQSKGMLLLRKEFWWGVLASPRAGRGLVTETVAASKKTCRSTTAGPQGTLVDSLGLQCKASELSESGCCFGGWQPQASGRDLARYADRKPGRMQQPQSLQRLAVVLQAAAGIVPGFVRIVDADAKRELVWCRAQQCQLMCAADERRGAVGQHQRGRKLQRTQQDVLDSLEDQRFTAGEGETSHPARSCLLEHRRQLRQRGCGNARVARLAALVAERTGEIACSAGVHPQFVQVLDDDGGWARCTHGRGC